MELITIAIIAYSCSVTIFTIKLFLLLWGRNSHPANAKAFGDDRRKIQYKPLVEIPKSIKHIEQYWRNPRGNIHSTHIYIADDDTSRPECIIFQHVGFCDTNDWFPRQRSLRLVQEGKAIVIGLDTEGAGRSDGMHAYIEDFNNLVEDNYNFFQHLRQTISFIDWSLPVFLLGESMGGNISIRLALKDKEMQNKYFSGAILLAPMVAIKDELKPPAFVINSLRWVVPFFPTLPLTPTPNILRKAFRRPEVYEIAKANPYSYTMKPRLGTALQLLDATEYVHARMEEFDLPVLVLQGLGDMVTDPQLAQDFHRRASSLDKEIKLYRDMWHSLLAGELEENISLVYQDIFQWLGRQIKQHRAVVSQTTPPTSDEASPASERKGGNRRRRPFRFSPIKLS